MSIKQEFNYFIEKLVEIQPNIFDNLDLQVSRDVLYKLIDETQKQLDNL